MTSAADTRFDSIIFVDPVRRINSNHSATTSCTECTPLLGRRPVRNGQRINFALLSLGILLIGGVSVGSYLLAMDNREIPVKLVFDMVDRMVWDSNGFPAAPYLISSHVRNIYIMQTNGFDCHNYAECVAIIQNMQITSMKSQNTSMPYNFLIGGDGETYEIRGWSEQSGFTFLPHNSSLAIGLLGTFDKHPPPVIQLTETYALILESLRRHKIMETYQLFGIRNLKLSSANSRALLKSISEWDHWNSTVNLEL